ncbi:hypothetical protein I6F09_03500 [Bradyrhizobium sp. IC3195]|uniref:esterase/lipase family protein n=1 Tax=Bradyrhizobium sp. IC3195 TaxID=2793804 RepID=UPI001CD4A83B|nr:hypothetical protein [Bradyrhizobium sp. IC3195]MCA1466955.1 hypothetical protein [Bradyrhizobium sp. IC3195]
MSIETVVIVHGTFSSEANWWRRGSEFCRRLDLALELVGSPARCWAHVPSAYKEEFYWSGRNSEVDRRREAAYLLAYLTAVAMNDDISRIHVVAHSHGGNLVYHALNSEGFFSFLSYKIASVTFLGTPFLDYSSFAKKLIQPSGDPKNWIYSASIGERHKYTGTFHGLNAADCYCLYFENDEAFHLLSHAKEIEVSPERYGYAPVLKFVSVAESYAANYYRVLFCHGRRLAKYVPPKSRYTVPLILGMTVPWSGLSSIGRHFSVEKNAIQNFLKGNPNRVWQSSIVALHLVLWPLQLAIAISIWLLDHIFFAPAYYLLNRFKRMIERSGIRIAAGSILGATYVLDRLARVSRDPPYVHTAQRVLLDQAIENKAVQLAAEYVHAAVQKLYGLPIPPAQDVQATLEYGILVGQVFTDPALLHCQYYAHPEVAELIASFVKKTTRREELYEYFRRMASE